MGRRYLREMRLPRLHGFGVLSGLLLGLVRLATTYYIL